MLRDVRKPQFIRPACRETAIDPVREGFDAEQARFPLARTRQPGDAEFGDDRRHQLVIDVHLVRIEQCAPRIRRFP
jgi:hypothetical protein